MASQLMFDTPPGGPPAISCCERRDIRCVAPPNEEPAGNRPIFEASGGGFTGLEQGVLPMGRAGSTSRPACSDGVAAGCSDEAVARSNGPYIDCHDSHTWMGYCKCSFDPGGCGAIILF
jgi:hypothetical protein